MQIKFSIVITLFFSLFLQQSVFAATQIQATVSDNVVFLGDRFALTIIINDTDSDFRLDTGPLEKNFTVSRPSKATSNNYINGKSSHQTKWQIYLQAKKTGELTIPALTIGGLTTNAIKITVNELSAQATKTEGNLIFMENSIDKNSAYLGQPLIFTSKIYIAQSSSDLDLIAPQLEGATVAIHGEDKKGQTIRNGIRYETITRNFKISSNKTGSFTINSPLLTGNSREKIQVNEWQDRVVSKPFNIRGDNLQVTIKEKPANYQGEWLISEDVQLFETSTLDQQTYHVGEPITRSITLQVASIDTDKLPIIQFDYPKNIRFYPDQDELNEGDANGLHYAQRLIRHAIIAEQAGKLTLPEVKLAWWNSQTDKQEFAIIPAQTLTILAAEKKPAEITTNNPAAALTDKQQSETKMLVDNQALIIWQIVCALLLLALLAMIIYHLSYRRAQNTAYNKSTKKVQPSNQAYLNLQEALTKQQAAAVYQALLNYAQSEFSTLKSLSQLTKLIKLNKQEKAALTAEIKALENACADPSITWNSAQLAHLIKKYQQQKDDNNTKDIMDLNPY